ncbi:MAG: diguanylate cyclase [Myxococcota bacterium]
MPCVLVVEDNPITRKLVRISLQGAGIDVAEAATASAALEVLNERRVDLVLQDLALADMDGFELYEMLKHLHGLDLPPVVAFTGLADRQRVRAAGFADLLLKPIEPVRLVAYVHARLGTPGGEVQSSGAHAIRGNRAVTPEALLGSPIWTSVSKLIGNLADLTGGAAEFDDVLRSALASFLDSCGFQRGAAYLPSSEGALQLSAQLGFHGPSLDRLGMLAAGPSGLLERVMKTNEPMLIDSLAMPDDARLLADLDARALLIVPISHGRSEKAVFVAVSANRGVDATWLEVGRLMAAPIGQSLALAASVARLSASEHRFRGIAESTRDGIVVTNNARITTYANASAARLLGRDGSELLGVRVTELIPFVADGVLAGTLRLGGRDVPLEISEQTFEDPPGHLNRVYVLRDLSERLRLEELAWLANHDPLTGLVNRRRFEEELNARILESQRYGTGGALLALDLDEFKPINDTHGHAAGDSVLRAVAEVLKSVTRATDLAARIGGDEFAVLLNHTSASGADTCARKLVERISDHIIAFEGVGLRVGASVGVALLPEDGSTRQQLFAAADRALYASKQAGRRCVTFSGLPPKQSPSDLPPESRGVRDRLGVSIAPRSERRG